MGVDLSLLPVEGHGATWFARTALACERRPGLFGAIEALEAQQGEPAPAGFKSLLSRGATDDGPRYGVTEQTAYGERLRQLPAGALAALGEHPEVLDNADNRAVWAYLAQLPAAQPVALFWR